MALGIAMSGVGLGGFIMRQLAQMLIERVGWRGAYPTLGLLTLAIAFPLVALWIREPRSGEGERRAITTADVTGLTVRGALGTRCFWLMGAAFFLVAIAVNGTVAHVVPLLADHGISAASAAAIMGIFGLATMAGRLLAGYLVDRIFAPFVAMVFFLAPIAGFVLLSSASGALPRDRGNSAGIGARHRDRPIAFWCRAIWDSGRSARSTATVS